MKIVSNMIVLRGMKKAGIIEFSQDTGKIVRHWTGQKVKAVYVSNGPYEFRYKNKTYRTKYFDGCFNPFVVSIDEDPKQQISFV